MRRARTHHVKFVVSDEQAAALREISALHDCTQSDYLRRLITLEMRAHAALKARGAALTSVAALPSFALQDLAERLGGRDG